jgi:hypothetical protein
MFSSGVTVNVRCAPEPARTTFAFGTSGWFVEVAVTTKVDALSSRSPIVNAIGPVESSSSID